MIDSTSGTTGRNLPGIGVGLGLLILMLSLSLYYWPVRTLFSDAAFQAFLFTSSGELAIMVQRYGAVLVQGPCVLAVKLGWSLPAILKVYSAAFTIYPLVFAILLWKPLHAPRLALIVVLFFGLVQAHTFFWIQNELIQACMLGLLLIGVVQRKPDPAWYVLPSWYALLALTIYTHPSVFPILLFMLVYMAWQHNKWLTWQYGSLVAVFILILIYKHLIAEPTWYDAQAFAQLEGTGERLLRLFSLPSTHFFAERLVSTYYLFGLAFFGTAIGLLRQKQWPALLLMLGGSTGWLLIILTRYHSNQVAMYMESYYLPLTIFVGFPLVYQLWGRGNRWWWTGAMMVILLVRISQIATTAQPYEQRLAWLKEQHQQMDAQTGQRFYLDKRTTNPSILIFDWGVPFETLMLSSLSGPADSKTLYLREDNEPLPSFINMKDSIPTPFRPYPYSTINATGYFKMSDTIPVQALQLKE